MATSDEPDRFIPATTSPESATTPKLRLCRPAIDWSSTNSTEVEGGTFTSSRSVGVSTPNSLAPTSRTEAAAANGLTRTIVERSPSAVDIPNIATEPRDAGTHPDTAATVPARLYVAAVPTVSTRTGVVPSWARSPTSVKNAWSPGTSIGPALPPMTRTVPSSELETPSREEKPPPASTTGQTTYGSSLSWGSSDGF